jgi:hypothetical protein
MDRSAASRLDQIAAVSRRDRVLIRAWWGASRDMDPTADKAAALLDLAATLDAVGAAYALIGGVAVGIHAGIPRATLDTDVAVTTTADRTALVAALVKAGFQMVGEFAHSVNLRHASGEPVQLAFDLEFDAMIQRAESLTVGTHAVRIVRKDDLIAMKRRAAADPARRRSKALRDQADVELLLGDVPDPDEGW